MSTELAVLMLAPQRAAAAFALEQAAIEYGIASTLDKAHWLAQCAHESGGFRYTRELGGRDYFDKYDTGRLADRLGNTPEADGDGALYKGRGYIQTTGRDNYLRASRALFGDDRLLDEPELLEVPECAARSAAYYWTREGLTKYAEADDVWACSRGVNFGNPHSSGTPWGMEDRIHWVGRFKQAFEEMAA